MAEISLPQAIAILKEKFKEARASKYVAKPISWALYQTWQKVDIIEKRRKFPHKEDKTVREILFRGKRLDNGEWVYGDVIHRRYYKNKDVVVIRTEDSGFDNYSDYGVDPETVEQFTGLTDKNGKKIFGGDIIKIVPDYDYSDDYSISKVYSYNGIPCVDYHGDDFDSTALGFLEDYMPDGDIEVIANIHDNPELLEADK